MNTHQLKEEILDFINHADERFLRLVYSMVESEKSETGFFNVTNDETSMISPLTHTRMTKFGCSIWPL